MSTYYALHSEGGQNKQSWADGGRTMVTFLVNARDVFLIITFANVGSRERASLRH